MKRLLIILGIAYFINIIASFSQDTIDPPKLNSFLPSSQYNSLIYRGATPFILGWNWSSKGSALDSALQMNTYHDFPMNETDIKPNTLVIQKTYSDTTNHIYKITAGSNSDVVLNAHCLHLEPTLTVDSTDNFKPRFGDNTGAVFGWYDKYVGDTVGLGNDDFSRFILNRNSVSSPTIVLNNIWKGDILNWLDYDGPIFF